MCANVRFNAYSNGKGTLYHKIFFIYLINTFTHTFMFSYCLFFSLAVSFRSSHIPEQRPKISDTDSTKYV